MSSMTYEQPGSLVKTMREAGVEHGDTTDLELTGVGVRDGETLCFCPATARVAETIRPGSAAEKKTPIPAEVSFSIAATQALRAAITGHGFIESMQVRAHSNGTIHFEQVRNIKFRPTKSNTCVNRPESYAEFALANA